MKLIQTVKRRMGNEEKNSKGGYEKIDSCGWLREVVAAAELIERVSQD